MRIVDLCILEIIVSLISLFSSVIARFGLSILRDIYIFRCGSICINGYVAHSVRIFQIVNCYIRSWNLGILSYLGTLSNLRILSNLIKFWNRIRYLNLITSLNYVGSLNLIKSWNLILHLSLHLLINLILFVDQHHEISFGRVFQGFFK